MCMRPVRVLRGTRCAMRAMLEQCAEVHVASLTVNLAANAARTLASKGQSEHVATGQHCKQPDIGLGMQQMAAEVRLAVQRRRPVLQPRRPAQYFTQPIAG